MPVIGAAFLLAIGGALARIHVEYDDLRPSPPTHFVNPLTGQIDKSGKVLGPAQPLCLKASHLAGRGGGADNCPVANYPTHCRVTTQPLGVVHVFVPGQPPEHRLAQKARQPMPTVLAGACVGQRICSRIGQTQRVVQFTVSQQSCIGGNRRTAKLEHQAAVEIEAHSASIRFTRRVHHRCPGWPLVRR
jgi:hypothetical protein